MSCASLPRKVFEHFATMLDYPRTDLLQSIAQCEVLLNTHEPEAAALLHSVRAALENEPAGRVEEAYTALFDMNPSRTLDIGYHVFGDNYKRSAFLIGLKERYEAIHFSAGSEMPDHLPVLLRYLACVEDAALREEILHDAVQPALNGIIGKPDDGADGRKAHGIQEAYGNTLRAMHLVLTHHSESKAAGDPNV